MPSGHNIVYSLSDPDFADDWWPCKQSLTDKIDSVTMWVTVNDTLNVGTNGLLQNVTTLPKGKVRYEWKTRYPIEYYLISVAVGDYSVYTYNMQFSMSTDNMPIQNFILDSAAFHGHLLAKLY